ncbi:MAG: hypothetical protein Q9182_000631 [Xanthomendoza sp. 2 TL-2023]
MTDPHASPPSSPTSNGTRTPLSLHLSAIPSLTSPSPPSNTLLITNLLDQQIFHPTSLLQIRTHISNHTPLHSFSPLKSLRRIIVSFYTAEDAITIHNLLDNVPIMGTSRARIYFGEPTPIEITNQHLHAPQSQKMFFISPPPSPPFGWQVQNEGPPNKQVHAEDLASALAGLKPRPGAVADDGSSFQREKEEEEESERVKSASSTTTTVYRPDVNGGSPGLPAVIVEDTTESEEGSPVDGGKFLAHTARPPVELMQDL